jgi:hypothetical protein
MKRSTFLLILMVWTLLLVPPWVWSESKPKGNPPVITNSFAIEKGYYGYIWKVYIEAEDLDGDMSKIAAIVHHPGYGHYPTDWIMLKSPYRKKMKGYLQWNTFSNQASHVSEWTNIRLTVTVIDKAGNESQEVVFPFEFVSGARKEPKPPAPFNEEGLPRLGHIHINLFDIHQRETSGDWEK